MRPPVDHPHDLAARVQFRDTLQALRRARGSRQADVADVLGVRVDSTLARQERATSWRLITVQRRAEAVGAWLTPRPTGLPTELPPDYLRPADPDRAMAWDAEALRGALVEARHELGLSLTGLADRLGVPVSTVWRMEQPGVGLRVCTAQRWCRELGGVLLLRLVAEHACQACLIPAGRPVLRVRVPAPTTLTADAA